MGKHFCDNYCYPNISDHTFYDRDNDYYLDLDKCDIRTEDQKSLGYLPHRDEFEYVN